ncbi:MAG: phosphate ABC transporter substrate-binding protein PstS [Phycisphaerales bacterium]
MSTLMRRCAGLLVLIGVAAAYAEELRVQGAGASFPAPIYRRWVFEYQKLHTDVAIDYQSIGSIGGPKKMREHSVDFGGTDQAISAEELEKEGWIQWPTVMGGIVISVNIPQLGAKANTLRLTGPLLADIYLGKITRWNDPAITAINPDLTMPDLAITPVWRADGSGTTNVFSHYLCEVSQEFTRKVGAGKAVRWPVGRGGKGGDSPTAVVQQTPGGVACIELGYADWNHLPYVLLQNRDGKFVACTTRTVTAAMANAHWTSPADFGKSLVNMPGADSWPIASATFILLPRQPADRAKAEAVIRFFDWCLGEGGKYAEALDYAPLSPDVVGLVREQWKGK